MDMNTVFKASETLCWLHRITVIAEFIKIWYSTHVCYKLEGIFIKLITSPGSKGSDFYHQAVPFQPCIIGPDKLSSDS